MSLRLAAPADAADLSRLHHASFENGWSRDDFVSWLSRKEGIAILGADGREPVAFGLALEAGAEAELLSIATDPAGRRGRRPRRCQAEVRPRH